MQGGTGKAELRSENKKAPEMTGLSHFQRAHPSAEMVMIDRMFNQEERASLSRDKRLALVDPGEPCQGEGRGELPPRLGCLGLLGSPSEPSLGMKPEGRI